MRCARCGFDSTDLWAVLPLVVSLLQREGRVTYRALKREFGCDEAFLEDLREVVRAYQETAAAVIARYDGYIAQYLGDGLLVYFGYPRAHEDDAQRAVRAGLEIVEAMGALNTGLELDKGVRLAVRLGIH